MTFMKCSIGGFENLVELFINGDYIIILTEENSWKVQQIRHKFHLLGLREGVDFFSAESFNQTFLPLFSYYGYGKCYVDFLDHVPNYTCTMRCKDCSACLPYLNKKNPSVEQLKEEIDLLFSKVDYLYTYDCTGGELFIISERYVQVLEYLLEKYSDRVGELLITTNATVIPSENMLAFLVKNKEKIRVNISNYSSVPGWQEKFELFKNVMVARGISCNLINASYWIDLGFTTTNIIGSEGYMRQYYDMCGTICKAYIDGKFAYCAHGYNASLAFYSEEDISEELLDLSDEKVTKPVILEFFAGYQKNGYLKICRHCNTSNMLLNTRKIPVAVQLERKG